MPIIKSNREIEIDTTVSIDIEEDVLDELDTEYIQEYLERRIKEDGADRATEYLINLCAKRRSRNLLCDKEIIKQTLIDIVEDLFG